MAMERWRPFGLSTADRWEPFGVSGIQTEVNRLFDSFVARPATANGRVWAPPVDMYATKDDLVLTLLREKTEGNRSTEETQVLDDLIYDLQLRYVNAAKSPG